MTDKEKIIAEIERRIKWKEMYLGVGNSNEDERKRFIEEYKSLLSFINSLPPKPVSEGLEEMADKMMPSKYCWSGDGETTLYTRKQMKEFFKDGAKWNREQFINKACGWLKDKFYQSPYDSTKVITKFSNIIDVVNDFKQTMEE